LAAALPSSPEAEAFRQGLRDLGYVEGQNVAVEYRSAEGRNERLPELLSELLGLSVQVIVTAGEPAIRAARQATDTLPIVMAVSGDPVGNGLVESLARPGKNITGLSFFATQLGAKRLEFLNSAVPSLARVVVISPQVEFEEFPELN
jgi:putative ABC transport system substrate-binding protein